MLLGDRYQLQAPIGRGGLVTIYRGCDIHIDPLKPLYTSG